MRSSRIQTGEYPPLPLLRVVALGRAQVTATVTTRDAVHTTVANLKKLLVRLRPSKSRCKPILQKNLDFQQDFVKTQKST